jgi:hypothetical protein
MIQDTIIEDIHRIREQLLAKFQGDFKAYFTELQRLQSLRPQAYASFAKESKPVNALPDTA